MLGFTLSKMNLLILVIAVFAITSYFLFGLSQIMLEKAGTDYIISTKNIVYGMIVTSESLCDQKPFYLPSSLEVNPTNTFGRGLYYKLTIKSIDTSEDDIKKIIFQITPRTKPEQLIAADSFDVNAVVKFFEHDPSDNDPEFNNENLVELDPQGYPPTNTIIIVMQVVNGKKNVFFVPCTTTSSVRDDCSVRYDKAGEKAFSGQGFLCEFNPGGTGS
ncbi:MAG: hypothetical protein ABIE23_04925 [archaeon]